MLQARHSYSIYRSEKGRFLVQRQKTDAGMELIQFLVKGSTYPKYLNNRRKCGMAPQTLFYHTPDHVGPRIFIIPMIRVLYYCEMNIKLQSLCHCL